MLKKRRRRKKNKVTKVIKNIYIGIKLITNTKKLKLKIQSRVWNFKNTTLKKRREKKGQKLLKKKKYIYMKFALKKQGLFFAK